MIVTPPSDTSHQARCDHPDKPVQGDDEDYVEYLGRCADHWSTNPPAAPEGFELIECSATPRHWPEYHAVDSDFYDAECSHCQYAALAAAHAGCVHSHHKFWQRWKITGKFSSWLYSMGITASGGSWQMGGGCTGCYTLPKFNRHKRVYALGVSMESWRCILKAHHRPGDQVAGLCTKCYPCPTCGSKTATHEPGCEYA